LVADPTLSSGAGLPTCFQLGAWGDGTLSTALSADVPAGSDAGTRSFSITTTGRTSGDAKLLPAEAAGCAPTVVPGRSYDVSIDYRSSSSANALTVFQHTATGWSYWTDLQALPATTTWATAHAIIEAIPAGVDRISFGI
ncbi:hypothetical protein ACC691_36510, partial [Rhizobium johnstonii]|uniref:hypothetical protein n=1 Tax=Rhizobium johnstonii TaxID=3019933 RepID=UPI003F945F39